MELGIRNSTLAINDIIKTLIDNLPSIPANHILINLNRFNHVQIMYDNQTKNSRANSTEILEEYKSDLLKKTNG